MAYSVSVDVKNVNKEFMFGDTPNPVLFDINLQVNMGEMTMLVGPSGCGKTTLISILSGILSPTSGDVTVIGQTLTQMTDREKVLFRRQNIGFIFQQYNLLPALTAAENAAMPLIAAGVPFFEAVSRAGEVLAQIGMAAHVGKRPNQLSGGQQQRVAIARSLVHNPRLIVCDEPTAALDAKTGLDVMQILRDISNEGHRSVLVVTHDSRIYRFSDRILEMSDGRIIGDHHPDQYIHKE
jgi:putative ABC transport system ATP-binding protein